MRPAALLARAHSLGITVEVEGETLAVTSERTPPPDLLAQIRTHKAALVEHLQGDLMPAGAGICPCCGQGRWLLAVPGTTTCAACAALQADEAETCIRGETP